MDPCGAPLFRAAAAAPCHALHSCSRDSIFAIPPTPFLPLFVSAQHVTEWNWSHRFVLTAAATARGAPADSPNKITLGSACTPLSYS